MGAEGELMGSLEGVKGAAQVYRNLLKAVKKFVGKEKIRPQFTDFIRDEFRNRGFLSYHPSYIQKKLKFARDYTFYLNSVHHHKVLLVLISFPTEIFQSFFTE